MSSGVGSKRRVREDDAASPLKRGRADGGGGGSGEPASAAPAAAAMEEIVRARAALRGLEALSRDFSAAEDVLKAVEVDAAAATGDLDTKVLKRCARATTTSWHAGAVTRTHAGAGAQHGTQEDVEREERGERRRQHQAFS